MSYLSTGSVGSQMPVSPAPSRLRTKTRILGVGGARCGTTYIARVLRTYPYVVDCGIKEHHFYDSYFREGFDGVIGWPQETIEKHADQATRGEKRNEVIAARKRMLHDPQAYWQQYLAYASGANVSHLVDITPAYGLIGAKNLAEAFRSHPDTRVILLLRDPIERFYSGCKKQALSSGRAVVSVVERELEAAKKGMYLIQARKSRMGRIVQNVSKAVEYADGSARLFVGFHEDMFDGTTQELERILRFCDIDPDLDARPVDKAVNMTTTEQSPEWLRRELGAMFCEEYDLVRAFMGNARLPAEWLK